MNVTPQLTKAPPADVGMLVRRPPHAVFEALADPSVTTRFLHTKSTGRMAEGAELTWERERYRALLRQLADHYDEWARREDDRSEDFGDQGP